MKEKLEQRIEELKAQLEQSAVVHNGMVGRLMEAQSMLAELPECCESEVVEDSIL